MKKTKLIFVTILLLTIVCMMSSLGVAALNLNVNNTTILNENGLAIYAKSSYGTDKGTCEIKEQDGGYLITLTAKGYSSGFLGISTTQTTTTVTIENPTDNAITLVVATNNVDGKTGDNVKIPAKGNEMYTLTSSSREASQGTIQISIVTQAVNVSLGDTIGNGTVTVSSTTDANGCFTYSATPANGYFFFGFKYGNSYIEPNKTKSTQSFSSVTSSSKILSDATLFPVFAKTDSAMFYNNGLYYPFLNEALENAALATTDKVVKVFMPGIAYYYGSDFPGYYEIKKGVTLWIPYGEGDTGVTDLTAVVDTSITTPYCTLTLTHSINVYGELMVNARLGSAAGARYSGYIAGTYGQLVLSSKSVDVNVQNGGILRVRGLITGSGTVTASSGAQVYQMFEITDWPGGKNALGISGKYSEIKENAGIFAGMIESLLSGVPELTISSFPLNQFYIQNIQVATKYTSGAILDVYYGIYVPTNESWATGTVRLLGVSDAFLNLTSGWIVFEYDQSSAKTTLDICGDLSVANLSLKVSISVIEVTIDSASYICPISGAFDFVVISGTTTISHAFKMLPGVTVEICEGATLKVDAGGSLYFYDTADTYERNGYQVQYRVLPYSNTLSSTLKTVDETGSKLIVNGTLEIASGGAVYTRGTGSGSPIQTTADTGVIIIASTYEATNMPDVTWSGTSPTAVSVSFNPAYGHLVSCSCGGKAPTGSCIWSAFSAGTYYSNGNAWYRRLEPTTTVEYRLNDYIWLNAKLETSASGAAKVIDENWNTLADFRIVTSGTTYYIVRAVNAVELNSELKAYVQIGEYRTDELDLSFTTYIDSIENPSETTQALLDAMLDYGKAAEDYFDSDSTVEIDTITANITGSTEVTDAFEQTSYDGIDVFRMGVTMSFTNCINFVYGLDFSGISDWGNVVQIGLLVSDATESELTTASGETTAYLLYSTLGNAGVELTNPNLPAISDYSADALTYYTDSESLMAEYNANKFLRISYSMLYSDYAQSFTYRPYILLKTGENTYAAAYGEQFTYSLATYLARRADAEKTDEESNFINAVWNYMEAVAAWEENV